MRIALVSFLPLLASCGLVRLQGAASTTSDGVHHAEIDGSSQRVGPYWGPECVRIGAHGNRIGYQEREAEPTQGKQPNLAHDPADQVLRLVCVETIMSDHDEPARNTWVTQHFRFDELFFDHLTASMMLVQCLEAASCLDAPHVPRPSWELRNAHAERLRADQAAEGPKPWQLYQAGMMRWYADRVDPAQVAKRVAALPLPPAAQQAYLRLFEQARAGVIEMTNTLVPEARAMFVDLPVQVFERRAAEHARSSEQLAELGVLIERVKAERAAGMHTVSDETVARLAKLRLAHRASCKQDCTRGTIFAAITQQLFWAHVSRGDAPAAMAESKLLATRDPTAAQEIATAQRQAIRAEIDRVSRVAAARRQGLDAEAARSTSTGAMFDVGDGRYVYTWDDEFKIHWASLVPGAPPIEVTGKVAGIDRRGAQVTVRFQDVVSKWVDDDHDSCVETNRVDRVRPDGTLVYRERCSRQVTKIDRHKTPPIAMAATEAAGLAPGDELVAFAASGPNQARVGGRVWLVKRGGRVVRLRDVPR